MKAITIPEFGGPEAMVLSEVPDPEPRAGEVLVRVAAAGVNRADVLQRQGHYAPPPGESDVPGLEVSGTIEALGDGVEGWSVGDEVCALLSGGGYAELVRVPAGQLLPVPAGVSLINAAALPEVTCTVWSNVFLTANLQPGETLLVHGGSSGIGTMAIQLGRAIAEQAGIPLADDPFDARHLPEEIEDLADVLETHGVFGRVTPTQKRAMVGALQSRGHTVAMTGDGVNDVLALKDADLGIAMGSGAAATRAVAQIVLLDNQFSVMPSVVAEGRRVLGNIERVSSLFLTQMTHVDFIDDLQMPGQQVLEERD